ncbi:hypothetical protein CCICO_08765 [Corynebacterium ciconiae DSM 44920]|nr:hypothetical protein [Corynebacterium ciconiae]WKD61762.1 hypothetical protein CCICO_08765 [Corynebacterium ciconiae DSM 44920]
MLLVPLSPLTDAFLDVSIAGEPVSAAQNGGFLAALTDLVAGQLLGPHHR